MTLFLTDTTLNDLATASGPILADELSIHSANPGATGASEITVAARQAPVWGLGAAGELVLSAQEDFTGAPASTTVTHVGFWKAGVFRGSVTRTGGDAATNAAGEYSIASLSIPNTAA